MPKKNIGIIGHGFIGKALVKKLFKDKNYNIRVLDRNQNSENIPIKWIENDFRNKKTLNQFILGLDILIHLASSTVPASSNLSAEMDIKENISAMVMILDIARQINPKIYIIFASSASVYGNQVSFPISEKNMPKPISFHGLQKLSIEHFLRIYHNQYNINYASCRISNPYGPGQKYNKGQGLLSIIKKNFESNQKIIIYGVNECSRDFIHISDLVNALITLCRNRPINCEINISSGVETRIIDLINDIKEIYGKDIGVEYKDLRNIDITRSVLDNSLIKSLTNWRPKKEFSKGLKDFIKEDI